MTTQDKTMIEIPKTLRKRLKQGAVLSDMKYEEYLNYLMDLDEGVGKVLANLGEAGITDVVYLLDALAKDPKNIENKKVIEIIKKWRTGPKGEG